MPFLKQPMMGPSSASMRLPNELSHIDSDLCWCDPIVEFDEDGDKLVMHKEVTWN
jgi:hypothetical protein